MSPTVIDPGTGTVDERSKAPGVPGYRTAGFKSGYDPIETQREAAQLEGLLYRNLFTGRLRSRNPFLIAALILVGVCCALPMVLSVGEVVSQGRLTATMYCSGPLLVISGFFFFNASASLNLRRQRQDDDEA